MGDCGDHSSQLLTCSLAVSCNASMCAILFFCIKFLYDFSSSLILLKKNDRISQSHITFGIYCFMKNYWPNYPPYDLPFASPHWRAKRLNDFIAFASNQAVLSSRFSSVHISFEISFHPTPDLLNEILLQYCKSLLYTSVCSQETSYRTFYGISSSKNTVERYCLWKISV